MENGGVNCSSVKKNADVFSPICEEQGRKGASAREVLTLSFPYIIIK